MLVTTPHKKKKTKPNVRKSPGGRRNGNGAARGNGSGVAGEDYGRRLRKRKSSGTFSFPSLKPWKVILGAIAAGMLGLLYLNHVFATQHLLEEVQTLEREYNQARRTNADFRMTYDRMIGPADIYDKARELGFINAGPAEKVIEVNRDE